METEITALLEDLFPSLKPVEPTRYRTGPLEWSLELGHYWLEVRYDAERDQQIQATLSVSNEFKGGDPADRDSERHGAHTGAATVGRP